MTRVQQQTEERGRALNERINECRQKAVVRLEAEGTPRVEVQVHRQVVIRPSRPAGGGPSESQKVPSKPVLDRDAGEGGAGSTMPAAIVGGAVAVVEADG